MNNDLISRSYLKNLPFERVIHTDWGETAIPIEEIDNAPTVAVNCKDCDGYEAGYSAGLKDAERPQGKWIFLNKDEIMKVECPFCHKRKCCISNYCDCCGAKMKGGAE